MTIIFARRDAVESFKPVEISNPKIKDVFDRMEADGIGWNYEFVGDIQGVGKAVQMPEQGPSETSQDEV